jgi:hypothetical protein
MRIVNNPIDHRGEMFRDANQQSPSRQFVATQMHRASRTDLHRRRPHPTQRLHDSFNRRFINARSSVALSTFPFASALVHRRTVHQVIDLLIRPPGRNRYRPNNTIARLAPVSSSQAPPIIKLKMSAHISFGSSLAMISISLPASRIKGRFYAWNRRARIRELNCSGPKIMKSIPGTICTSVRIGCRANKSSNAVSCANRGFEETAGGR